MKWLFAILLAALIFGGAALFSYKIFLRPEIVMRAEMKAAATPRVTPDVSLPKFQAAQKLKEEGKLTEARAALTAFIQEYPSGPHVGRSAGSARRRQHQHPALELSVAGKRGIHRASAATSSQRIAQKMKSTPELIMRTNNLSGTMLHIGDKLLISHPIFSILIQREKEASLPARSRTVF